MLCESLAATLARAPLFCHARTLYVNGHPVVTEKNPVTLERPEIKRPTALERIPRLFALGDAVRSRVSETVRSYFVAQDQVAVVDNVFVTKIFTPKHPAFDSLKADGAISEELGGLLDMNAVKILLAETLPKNANVVGTRIFLALKEYQTEEERWNARVVVHGCTDRESRHTVSDAGSVAFMSVRMLLILGFSFGYIIWIRDVKQAYIRGGKLTRKIYATPPKEIRKCMRGLLLWILSPVYGLREAGQYERSFYMAMFVNKLSMKSTLIDRYFLYRHLARRRDENQTAEHDAQIDSTTPSAKRSLKLRLERYSDTRPDGLAAILVDDTPFAGTANFR